MVRSSAARRTTLSSLGRAYALREIDAFPALVPGDRAISGELYAVPPELWPALDEFEGEGYTRAQIDLADGARAIAYLARAPSAGTPLAVSAWSAARSER